MWFFTSWLYEIAEKNLRILHFIGVCRLENCILSEFATLKFAFYRSLEPAILHFIGVCASLFIRQVSILLIVFQFITYKT